MGSRVDEKQRRRAERERREAERTRTARRRRRLWLFGGVVAVAAAVVVMLALIGGSDDGPDGLGDGSSLTAAAEVNELFAGIPQTGITLGDPDAPVTLVEFADMQCPFCARFAVDALPAIVRDHVRRGDVKLELRLLTFLGPDSVRAAELVHAAALQGRGWQYADLFFNNQGPEGSGYATDEFLRGIGAGVDGLDVDRAFAQARGPAVDRMVARAASAARTLGVDGTPSFYVRRGSGALRPLELSDLSAATIAAELDRVLDGGR